MRVIVYFVIWTCVTVTLLFTFLYLLTIVDPGLKELPLTAAKMMRNEPYVRPKGPTMLPPAQYIDFEEFVKASKKRDSNKQ